MDDIPAPAPTPGVPPVEPDQLGTAVFLFSEYLDHLAADTPVDEDEEENDDEEEDERPSPIRMREVLDLFAEELGTNVPTTLNLYMRVTALFRLLAASPSLARLASADDSGSGVLSEDALLAFARLDVHVTRSSEGTIVAEFDPRELREALASA